MLGLLESRLDNVVHRLGFTFTRSQGRQLVRHGHVLVNGKRVDIPSVILRPGDKVEIRQKSREIKEIIASLAQVDKRPILSWLELDKANFAGTFKGAPVREEMNEPAIREQYVVEYYSR
jgi:small subunit ribosomal protein S4